MNRSQRLWLFGGIGLLAMFLLYWALKDVPFSAILATLSRLSARQLLILLMVNTGIMLLFGLRWWLILREMGHRIPFHKIALYRLTAFGVSYFTPGPQFGGEPLQVLFLRIHHKVSGTSALASVSFDKLIELIGNFSFLLIAAMLVIQQGLFIELNLALAQALTLALLFMPFAYFALLLAGRRPLSMLSGQLSEKWQSRIDATEGQLIELVRNKPKLLLLAMLASLIVWLALIFEYKLALSFLGLDLSISSVLAIMLFARLAMLAPTPGALGALEAGLVLSMSALNLAPAIGLGLGLLIRARDVLFGGMGLLYGLAARRTA